VVQAKQLNLFFTRAQRTQCQTLIRFDNGVTEINPKQVIEHPEVLLVELHGLRGANANLKETRTFR
jgi:hypothetical protein